MIVCLPMCGMLGSTPSTEGEQFPLYERDESSHNKPHGKANKGVEMLEDREDQDVD